MGVIDNILAFISSMHISAIIIIAIILAVFFLSLVFMFFLKFRYGGFGRELNPDAGAPGAARSKNSFLEGVVSEYETAWSAHKGVEVNTQAIIETYFINRAKIEMTLEGFTRHSVSVMIVFGLLGTFIGLTLSVQSLVLLFKGYDVTELLGSVESGLLSALVGMSTAFTTSLFGIACSVVITILGIFMNPGQARENLMVGIEEYLDNVVSSHMKNARGDEYDQINITLRSIFIEFGERIAERFDRSLMTLREDVRGIEDVNNNLRNTIEQMDVCFVRIADALKASTRHVDDNYKSLANLSARFKDISGEFETARKDGALQSEKLAKSVTEAAQAITGLTGDLRGEAQRRLDNFSAYEDAVNRMAASAELIRNAVAVIPEQMYAYSEASGLPPAYAGASKPPSAYEGASGANQAGREGYGAEGGDASESGGGDEGARGGWRLNI